VPGQSIPGPEVLHFGPPEAVIAAQDRAGKGIAGPARGPAHLMSDSSQFESILAVAMEFHLLATGEEFPFHLSIAERTYAGSIKLNYFVLQLDLCVGISRLH
jgi:hypothetical protein